MSIPVVPAARGSSQAAPTISWPNLAAQWGLISVLAVTPLPLGAVFPLGWSIVAIATGVLLVVTAMSGFFRGALISGFGSLRIPAAMAVIVVLWGAFQQFPVDISGWNATLWDHATRALGEPVQRSISLDRERSLGHLLRLMTYSGIFLVAWNVGQRSEAAAKVMQAMGFIGTAYAIYGLIVYFAGNRMVLWYVKTTYNYDLTGTFVGRNAFAAFLGLCLLAEVALLAQALEQRADGRSMRTLLQSLLEVLFRDGVWISLGLTLTASALLLTHSRGGIVATLAGAFSLVVAYAFAPSLRASARWPIAAVLGAGTLIVLIFVGSGFLARVSGSASELSGRTEIYGGTLEAIADHPVLGTGLGTFEFVFPPYQPISELKRIEFAHNEYLQTGLELGLPIAIVVFAILGLLLLRCVIGVFTRRRNVVFPCLAVGASVLAMAHSAVDFSMEIPAVAVTLAALLGIGVAQSVGSGNRAEAPRDGNIPRARI